MWHKLIHRQFARKGAGAPFAHLRSLASSRVGVPEAHRGNLGISPKPSSDFSDVGECERMFVSALMSADQEAVARLQRHLLDFPLSHLHPDTFGNLLVSLKNDPVAVLSLATSHALEAWISTWNAPEVEGWAGGVGGRASAASSFLRATSTVLRPGTPSVMALGALCRVLDFYGYLLAAHSAGNLPRPLAVISAEDMALLHNDIKYWRWFTADPSDEDGSEEHPEDILLHLCVAQTLSAAKRERSRPQPSLALLALLEPRLANNRAESDLQAFLQIFCNDVLAARAPEVTSRDVHLLLSSFCPPWQLQKHSGNVAATTEYNADTFEEAQKNNQLGIKQQRDWDAVNNLQQNLRFSAARTLFLWCLYQSNSSYLLSSESLEVAFRIAGATADKQFLRAVLDQFARQSSRLSPNEHRRVVSAAFHGLRDWIAGGTPGPAVSASTAMEYFPMMGRDATSAQRWTEAHRQVMEFLAALPLSPHNGSAADTKQRASSVSTSLFAIALREAYMKRSWEDCVELLEAWLRVGRGAGELTPRMLFYVTTAFVHFEEPVRALKLLELVHSKHSVRPDTDTFRLLCINLAKSSSPAFAERAWALANSIYTETPNPLYRRDTGYRLDGPCLAEWRSRWLIRAGQFEALELHVQATHTQMGSLKSQPSASSRHMPPGSPLLHFYACVVRAASEVDVDVAMLYLRKMLELPGARQDSVAASRTINFVIDSVLAEGRTVRAASLIQELEAFRAIMRLRGLRRNDKEFRSEIDASTSGRSNDDDVEWKP